MKIKKTTLKCMPLRFYYILIIIYYEKTRFRWKIHYLWLKVKYLGNHYCPFFLLFRTFFDKKPSCKMVRLKNWKWGGEKTDVKDNFTYRIFFCLCAVGTKRFCRNSDRCPASPVISAISTWTSWGTPVFAKPFTAH